MFLLVLLLLGGVSCSSPQHGFITSPDFPKMYPTEKHITWNIAVPEGFHISLKFLVFNIELSEGCSRDFVTISEPRNVRREIIDSTSQVQVDRKKLGQFCGPMNSSSHPGHRLFVSNGNQLTIDFHSDSSNEQNDPTILYSGFKAHYQAVDNDECASPNIEGSSPCQHFCHNYIGGHYCSCLPEFELQSDTRSCKVIAGKDCKTPQELRNGRYTNLTEPDNTMSLPSIIYSCNEPYYKMVTERGSATFTCSKFGVWMDENGEVRIPTCVPVCGKPSNPVTGHGRIISGADAEVGSFPWQVLLVKTGRGGGILIGEHWVMTAAHVIREKEGKENLDDANDLHVFIGDTNVENLVKQSNLAVREVHVHPGYVSGYHDHDIALIRLQDPVTMDQNTSPICLPEDADETLYEAGTVGYVSGFGMTEKNKISNLLKYVALPMVQRDKCQQQLTEKQRTLSSNSRIKGEKFTENMFCAGFPEANKRQQDSCQGDSGGPYASLNEDKWVATGIVSWGIGCGTGYGYYTKVSKYIDWIKGHMNS